MAACTGKVWRFLNEGQVTWSHVGEWIETVNSEGRDLTSWTELVEFMESPTEQFEWEAVGRLPRSVERFA